MKTSLRLLAILGLSLSLSSCVGETSSSIASSVPNVSSSERVLSSALSSSAKPSVPAGSSAEESSSEKPSSDKPLPSSSAAVYYTVSIYQSYYIEKEGRYGNPRFDTSVTRKAGEYIYNSAEEKHELEMLCCPFSPHSGGLYISNGFYIDQECTKLLAYGVKVDSDMRIYYYCF